MFEVVVIGGGPAGVTAALRARELGASVALIERERLGGTCTNDGCVPTRVLAKAARLMRDAEQFEHYGLIGEPPILNFERLLAHTQRIVYTMHEKKQIGDHLTQAGVTVFANTGSARFVDEHTLTLADKTTVQGKKIIICAGGHARRFTFPGSEHTLTHSDVWSLKQLPRSVAVVGAAATGCQLASIFAAFGSRVWLLDVAPRILPGEDPLVSQVMGEAFRQRSIKVITGIDGVERIDKTDDGLEILYARQGQLLTLPTEAVIYAVGWVGNIEDLNLAAANVHSERSYIIVDDHLRTSTPHIFAAGDITGRMMLVQSGSYEGRVAAENAVLDMPQIFQHQIVPHGGFTDPEYGSVGLTAGQARATHADSVTVMVPYVDLDRAVIDGHTEGFCQLIVSRETHHLLGAHVVGEQAVEIVQLVAAGMAADVQVEQLARVELAYPTYTAIVGLAARQLVRDLGATPLAPQWRSLGRRDRHVAEWEQSEV